MHSQHCIGLGRPGQTLVPGIHRQIELCHAAIGIQTGCLPLTQTKVLANIGEEVIIGDILHDFIVKCHWATGDNVVNHAVIFADTYPVPMLSFPHTYPGGTAILYQIVGDQKPITVPLVNAATPRHVVDDIVVDLVGSIGCLKKDRPVGRGDVM